MLRDNMWVKTAYKLAPSNLVVRHICILDIIENKTKRISMVSKLLFILSPDNLWAEGYSYWLYTRIALSMYAKHFNIPWLGQIIYDIDTMFDLTSYEGLNGQKWPAPFGDLRHIPLKKQKDIDRRCNYSTKLFNKVGNIYYIYDYPLGFNTHCEVKRSMRIIDGGRPLNFKFYEGYTTKYNSKPEEVKDTFFNWKRIKSIFRRR